MVVDILILGAGWLSNFLIPLCSERDIPTAATTRDGRDGTLAFIFDARSDDVEPYKRLPDARTVLITFPITESGGSKKLVDLYVASRQSIFRPDFIQLGTTSIWEGKEGSFKWFDRHSTYSPEPRAIAEQELLGLSPDVSATILNLSGLWGGSRLVKNWVWRVAGTKQALTKTGSLHMIHGIDVSRAILAVHGNFSKAAGQRWILTDSRVYDWWDLAAAWGTKSDPEPQARWVRELMQENDIRALPRNVELLGRALDSREFWETFDLSPIKTRLD
ncbi:hypothetical protein AX15_005472 [Amanita polypyramis BW_CC]|nr:hypothetical protein AX15_005472 [Amanita polypyramis BW_CC]